MTPGVNLAVGVSGAGKTYSLRNRVYAATATHPVMVIDPMREWRTAPASCNPMGARDVPRAIEAVNKGHRLVVVETNDVQRDAELACEWARQHRDCGVAMPEAHRIAPNGDRLSGALDACATAWRHYRVTMWLDTQRIALLHKTLTEQASEILIFAIYGVRDLAVIKEWGGPDLREAVRQCAAKLADGEPGWCVRLGMVRKPPYKIERIT